MAPFELTQNTYTEADDLAAGLGSVATSAVQFRPGRFRATVSTLPFDDVRLQILRSDPVLLLGNATDDEQGIALVPEGGGAALWNGRTIGRTRAALITGSAAHSVRFARSFTALLLRCSSALPLLPAFTTARQRETNSIICGAPAAFKGLVAIAKCLESSDGSVTAHFDDPEARRSLRADILAAMRVLLDSADRVDKPRRPRMLSHRIVHEADAYLRSNPSRPVYTEDLHNALGISASSLADAFRANFGISPHRYLKMRRMGMARAMLLSREGPWHSVKAAALSNGFWHLGQFAKDYRATYGEAPHVTLARGLSTGRTH